MIKCMINFGEIYRNRPNLLRRFHRDQNLISDFIKEKVLDVNHILIRGHNHINGMTEKVIDTLNQDMTYEHNGESLVNRISRTAKST